MRQIWEWLQHFQYPDDRLLIHLRSAHRLEIHYPAAWGVVAADAAWRDYLRSRLRRHILWLAFYEILSPLTLILAPLPGPNVVGYWFVYRAVHHLLVVIGVVRARRERIPTTLVPSGELDITLQDAERDGGTHPHEVLSREQPLVDEFLGRSHSDGKVES